MVKAFFCGSELPKFITHTNLVLIPTKDIVNSYTDMKPLSLSNFVNKILSRINHLSYADDTILFCSRDGKPLKKMLKILKKYEKSSGQLINSEKRCPIFYGKRRIIYFEELSEKDYKKG
ncbi:hypothetical protein H5410_030050 [Solanum commersonii]|uniref:Reverse transcriptase domain-containing protein n=1 Tax=Solanum commersonii TaxID=4109 RepID=A0A9J5YGC5_SOLCO|nr:hypothetical protein H5410_030050 [Solanum commersonii]